MKSELLNFYSFFTKYSIMEEYGFSSGILKRVYRKVLPSIPDTDTVEYFLLKTEGAIPNLISQMDFSTISDSDISRQLDLSIKALYIKVIAFGLDSNIKAKYNFIELNSKPFEILLNKVNKLSEYDEEEILQLFNSLKAIELLIIDLRKNKSKIGANFHLTLTTRRILEYTKRIEELIQLKLNISSKTHWENLFSEYIEYAKHKDSIRRYLSRHADLVLMEVVEHTSNKGQKYIAETRKDYWRFFYKSLFGGGIIAIFAFFKIIISSYHLSTLSNAFFFSLNYALCFIIVKQLGGIIATKQPAMTASTLAKNINTEGSVKIDSIKSITIIVRKVFRSQFISVMGNFFMAVLFAIGIMYILQLFNVQSLLKIVDSEYLIHKIVPTGELVFFASVAGFFLSLSGFISGYVDNKVIASKIPHRINNSRLLRRSKRLGSFFEKKAGTLFGNISLGLFLGSSFLLTFILPIPIDIRHVAFSSANLGVSVMNYHFDNRTIALGVLGALLIGLVNFIVSFSVTFYLALKSRGANLTIIPEVIYSIFKDFLRNPLHYFIKIEKEPFSKKENDE